MPDAIDDHAGHQRARISHEPPGQRHAAEWLRRVAGEFDAAEHIEAAGPDGNGRLRGIAAEQQVHRLGRSETSGEHDRLLLQCGSLREHGLKLLLALPAPVCRFRIDAAGARRVDECPPAALAIVNLDSPTAREPVGMGGGIAIGELPVAAPRHAVDSGGLRQIDLHPRGRATVSHPR